MDKAWKANEREAAAFFGAKRNPGSGAWDDTSSSDSAHASLFIETKRRVSFAVTKILEKARRLARKENKIAVVCQFQHHKTGFQIIIDSRDFPTLVSHYLAEYGYDLAPHDLEPTRGEHDTYPRPLGDL